MMARTPGSKAWLSLIARRKVRKEGRARMKAFRRAASEPWAPLIKSVMNSPWEDCSSTHCRAIPPPISNEDRDKSLFIFMPLGSSLHSEFLRDMLSEENDEDADDEEEDSDCDLEGDEDRNTLVIFFGNIALLGALASNLLNKPPPLPFLPDMDSERTFNTCAVAVALNAGALCVCADT